MLCDGWCVGDAVFREHKVAHGHTCSSYLHMDVESFPTDRKIFPTLNKTVLPESPSCNALIYLKISLPNITRKLIIPLRKEKKFFAV